MPEQPSKSEIIKQTVDLLDRKKDEKLQDQDIAKSTTEQVKALREYMESYGDKPEEKEKRQAFTEAVNSVAKENKILPEMIYAWIDMDDKAGNDGIDFFLQDLENGGFSYQKIAIGNSKGAYNEAGEKIQDIQGILHLLGYGQDSQSEADDFGVYSEKTKEAVKKLQTMLYENNYFAGEINGRFDKSTLDALKKFLADCKSGTIASQREKQKDANYEQSEETKVTKLTADDESSKESTSEGKDNSKERLAELEKIIFNYFTKVLDLYDEQVKTPAEEAQEFKELSKDLRENLMKVLKEKDEWNLKQLKDDFTLIEKNKELNDRLTKIPARKLVAWLTEIIKTINPDRVDASISQAGKVETNNGSKGIKLSENAGVDPAKNSKSANLNGSTAPPNLTDTTINNILQGNNIGVAEKNPALSRTPEKTLLDYKDKISRLNESITFQYADDKYQITIKKEGLIIKKNNETYKLTLQNDYKLDELVPVWPNSDQNVFAIGYNCPDPNNPSIISRPATPIYITKTGFDNIFPNLETRKQGEIILIDKLRFVITKEN